MVPVFQGQVVRTRREVGPNQWDHHAPSSFGAFHPLKQVLSLHQCQLAGNAFGSVAVLHQMFERTFIRTAYLLCEMGKAFAFRLLSTLTEERAGAKVRDVCHAPGRGDHVSDLGAGREDVLARKSNFALDADCNLFGA